MTTEQYTQEDNTQSAPVLHGDDPIVQEAINDIVLAVLKAADRVKAERDQKLTALRLVDIHALIDAAFAEPGSVDIEELMKDARALDGLLSIDDTAHLWKRLGELQEHAPSGAADAAVWADHLCYVSINMKPWEHMQPAPSALYHAGLGLIEDAPAPGPETLEAKMAHVMMLDALIASPEATQHVVRRLRDLLVASDDRLAMFTR